MLRINNLNKIVRYFEEVPKNTNQDSKWDTIHNSYYSQKANQAELYHYYKSNDGFIYFAIAKIAPSLKLKKVATIGKLKLEKDSVVYYEEICRTWKMEIPELKDIVIAFLTARSRSGETFAEPFITRETVALLTPADFATKSIVTSNLPEVPRI